MYVSESDWLLTSDVLDFVITAYEKAARGRKRDVERYG